MGGGAGGAQPEGALLLLRPLTLTSPSSLTHSWPQGANLRHMPEAMWFLFWCANTSPAMAALWAAGPPYPAPHARTRRVALRNALQHDIAALQAQFQHNPAGPGVTIADCFAALGFIEGKVPVPSSDKVAAVLSSDAAAAPAAGHHHHHHQAEGGVFAASDMSLLEDLVALGDGGFWCDRVLTPIFYVLAFEVRGSGCRTGQRVVLPTLLGPINLTRHLPCLPPCSPPRRWTTSSARAPRWRSAWATTT